MKRIFTVVIVTPILTLFLGIGVLALSIADSWDERNTDVLISNLSLACALGGMAVAFALTLLVGVVFCARWQQQRRSFQRVSGRHEAKSIPALPDYQPWITALPTPPATPEAKGKLYSPGPQGYEDLDNSLFGKSPNDDSEWEEPR